MKRSIVNHHLAQKQRKQAMRTERKSMTAGERAAAKLEAEAQAKQRAKQQTEREEFRKLFQEYPAQKAHNLRLQAETARIQQAVGAGIEQCTEKLNKIAFSFWLVSTKPRFDTIHLIKELSAYLKAVHPEYRRIYSLALDNARIALLDALINTADSDIEKKALIGFKLRSVTTTPETVIQSLEKANIFLGFLNYAEIPAYHPVPVKVEVAPEPIVTVIKKQRNRELLALEAQRSQPGPYALAKKAEAEAVAELAKKTSAPIPIKHEIEDTQTSIHNMSPDSQYWRKVTAVEKGEDKTLKTKKSLWTKFIDYCSSLWKKLLSYLPSARQGQGQEKKPRIDVTVNNEVSNPSSKSSLHTGSPFWSVYGHGAQNKSESNAREPGIASIVPCLLNTKAKDETYKNMF